MLVLLTGGDLLGEGLAEKALREVAHDEAGEENDGAVEASHVAQQLEECVGCALRCVPLV